VTGPYEAAARRWSQAALLLGATARAPSGLLTWLGPGWSGVAAAAYVDWAGGFESASRRAAGALRDAADAVRTAESAGRELREECAGVQSGAREMAGVRVPGERPAVAAHGSSDGQAEADPGGHTGADPAAADQPGSGSGSGSADQPPAGGRSGAEAGGGVPGRHAAAGSLGGWIDEAVRVLREHGYRPDQTDPASIATIIRHESSGDPGAVNDWDANAARGTPSMGLMQTIQPTFDRYRLPGHDQILDPVDNIIAGVRYAVARYGSVSDVPGIASLAEGGGYRGY
jgi:uncharacterized protein YukE